MNQSTVTFASELRSLINRYNKENQSDTPDFVLAKFVQSSLDAFNDAVNERESWFGCVKNLKIEELGRK